MCEAKKIFESTEYQKSKEELFNTILGLEAISNAPFFGSWVINNKFETLTISEQASKIIFNKEAKEVKHKSVATFDYVCENTNNILCMFKEMNEYVLKNFNIELNRYDLFQFYIKFKDTSDKNRFWRIIKYIEPAHSERDKWEFLITHALFLDTINENYENSVEQLTSLKRRKLIEKISDTYEIYLLKKA